jgi:ABC-2 type transport system ATP-binding protein
MLGCVEHADVPAEFSKPPSVLISVRDVSKNFGKLTAVEEVSFHVAAGTICGLVGSDGAGKTTLLRMVTTLLKPSSGRILINGVDAVRHRGEVKKQMGYMPQRFGLYPDLTVGENVEFFMDIFGIHGHERKRRREEYLGFSNLLPFVDRLARDLSGGMKQKLGLACVLVNEPMILILDEPTNGVDPVSRKEFWGILERMKKEGMTIVVATSYLDEGEKCDRLLLMHNARMIEDTTPSMLCAEFADIEAAIIHRIQEEDKTLAAESFKP